MSPCGSITKAELKGVNPAAPPSSNPSAPNTIGAPTSRLYVCMRPVAAENWASSG